MLNKKTINIFLGVTLLILGGLMAFSESKQIGSFILFFLSLTFFIKNSNKKPT